MLPHTFFRFIDQSLALMSVREAFVYNTGKIILSKVNIPYVFVTYTVGELRKIVLNHDFPAVSGFTNST
jgi:hypothetical protein